MSEDKWREFGFWLKNEREKAEVQQKDVAKKADIHVVQLSRIENGHSGAKRETIIDIVEATNNLSTGYKVDLNEALNRAGFASIEPDQSKIELPNGFEIIGFEDDIDPDDKREIAAFLQMKAEKARRKREEGNK